MKKIITICLIVATSFAVNAQQLSSGKYKVSISNLAYFNISGEILPGKSYTGKQIKGIYTIEKNGFETVRQKFTFTRISEYSAVLHLEEKGGRGNGLSYDFETKQFELGGNEYKAKKTKTTEDLILSGVLVYAQWLDENE